MKRNLSRRLWQEHKYKYGGDVGLDITFTDDDREGALETKGIVLFASIIHYKKDLTKPLSDLVHCRGGRAERRPGRAAPAYPEERPRGPRGQPRRAGGRGRQLRPLLHGGGGRGGAEVTPRRWRRCGG